VAAEEQAMSQILTVEIAEQSYRNLVDLAERRGKSPEALIADTIEQITEDPFEKWIGALPTNVPDWPSRHDELLGAEALNTHEPEKG
jgi:hypothetical protein